LQATSQSTTVAIKVEPQEDNDNILIAENGDILARYRIPLKDNKVDYDLQLPEDSDSSNPSEDNGNNQEAEEKEEAHDADNHSH